jgi:ELWxxDGT repeat protein
MVPVSVGANLYFDGFTAGGSVNGRFYRFDLNANALVPLAERFATSRAAVGQTLYFNQNVSELWKTDSVSGAVALVKRFDGSPVSLAASAGILYVAVAGGSAALWTSDGTESGTVPIWPGLALQLTDAAGTLYFVSNDYSSRQSSLWKIPAREPASVVQTFPLGVFSEGPISDLTASGGSLFFLLRDNSGNRALWKTDGTPAGTVPLSGVAVDTGSLRADESRAYFTASEASNGRELWRSDGTPQGTALVKDIHLGFAGSNPIALTIVDGILLFSADDGTHGRELWRSDGTSEGTYLLDDICHGACSSSPGGFAKSGGRIFFAASDEEAGRELWAMPVSALKAPPGRRPPSVVQPRK